MCGVFKQSSKVFNIVGVCFVVEVGLLKPFGVLIALPPIETLIILIFSWGFLLRFFKNELLCKFFYLLVNIKTDRFVKVQSVCFL